LASPLQVLSYFSELLCSILLQFPWKPHTQVAIDPFKDLKEGHLWMFARPTHKQVIFSEHWTCFIRGQRIYRKPFVSESDFSTHLICWLQILIDASNGASDYGNKFGEPLIQVHSFLYCLCSLWKVLNWHHQEKLQS
jgi:hypothetical protein